MNHAKRIILLAAVMLVSCSDIPEEVISRTDDRNQSISEAHTGELEYIPLSEMQADVEKALSEKYTNFTLRDGIKVRLPDALRKCDFVQVSGYISKAQSILENFIDQSNREGVSLTTESFVQDPGLGESSAITVSGFRDEKKREQLVVWDNGFINMFSGELFLLPDHRAETVKIYYTDRNDDLSDSYRLGQSDLTVKEAVSEAQKWIDENYAPLEPDYKIHVYSVKVEKLTYLSDTGEDLSSRYKMSFLAQKEYKGIKLDTISTKAEKAEGESIMSMVRCANNLQLWTTTDSMIEVVTNATGMVIPKEMKTLEKGVALSSALEYIEKTFADFNDKPEIANIQLKYTLSPEYDKTTQLYNAPGNKMKGRLVWEFVFSLSEQNIKWLKDNNPNYDDNGRYIQIDLENGEMDFSFDF